MTKPFSLNKQEHEAAEREQRPSAFVRAAVGLGGVALVRTSWVGVAKDWDGNPYLPDAAANLLVDYKVSALMAADCAGRA